MQTSRVNRREYVDSDDLYSWDKRYNYTAHRADGPALVESEGALRLPQYGAEPAKSTGSPSESLECGGIHEDPVVREMYGRDHLHSVAQ